MSLIRLSFKRFASAHTTLTKGVLLSAAMNYLPPNISSNDELVNALQKTGIVKTSSVEKSLRLVDRKKFVDEKFASKAYNDGPIETGCGQVLTSISSQITGIEALNVQPGEKILDVGCGVGFTSQILASAAQPGGVCYATEIHESLAERAHQLAVAAGLQHAVKLTTADCLSGVPSNLERVGPFDKVLLGFCVPSIASLRHIAQLLKTGATVVAPVAMPVEATSHAGAGVNMTKQNLMRLIRSSCSLEEAQRLASVDIARAEETDADVSPWFYRTVVDKYLWEATAVPAADADSQVASDSAASSSTAFSVGEVVQEDVFYSQALTAEDVKFMAQLKVHTAKEDEKLRTTILDWQTPLTSKLKSLLGRGLTVGDVQAAIDVRTQQAVKVHAELKASQSATAEQPQAAQAVTDALRLEVQRLAKEVAALKRVQTAIEQGRVE